MTDEKIAMRFYRHAVYQQMPGSWLTPKNPRISGHNTFIPDTTVRHMLGTIIASPVRITDFHDAPYVLPVEEIEKANKQRLDWLRKQFVTAADRIHREARAKPEDDFRYETLHPGNGEWTARFIQKSTGALRDFTLDELRAELKGLLKPKEYRALLLLADMKPPGMRTPDDDMKRALGDLKAIGPGIIRDPAFTLPPAGKLAVS